MAKTARFKPSKTASGTWCLNVPARYSESGKRERFFYQTKDKAMEAAAQLKEQRELFGAQATAISPSLAEAATEAANILQPWGLSIVEAARIVAAIREKENASKPVAGAVDAWMEACEHLRQKTIQGYRQTANRLRLALGDRLLATLTAEDLQLALTPKGTPPTAAAGHVRTGKAFWRWSAEQGWCDAATFDRVKPPKDGRPDGEIEVLTADEAARLLAVAEEHFPHAVASFALQLFAGIRAEELTRLSAENVTPEGIELGAAITKKGRRRHIVPSETLAAWLSAHPFTPCPNWRRVDRAARYLAGWKLAPDPDLVPESLIRGDGDATAPAWPQNALRHSHASYSVAAGVPLESLLFEFGHTGNPNVLRQHYVGRVTKKDALRYFAIRPGGKLAKAKLKTVKGAA
jgi:integrase